MILQMEAGLADDPEGSVAELAYRRVLVSLLEGGDQEVSIGEERSHFSGCDG